MEERRAEQFDPGYFGPGGQEARQQRNKIYRKLAKYRRPGLDAGTFLWPLLFAFLHIVIAAIVQTGFLFVKMFIAGMDHMASGIVDFDITTEYLMKLVMEDFPLIAAIYSVLQIIVYVLFLKKRESCEKNYVLREKVKVFEGFSAFFMIVGALGVAMAWMLLLNNLKTSSDFVDNLMEQYDMLSGNFEGSNLAVTILGLCILVPAAEELLFRGILMSELRRVAKPWLSVLISALLFAVFHMNIVQGVYVFVAGLALGLAYLATENIAVPICMHMIYNFGGSVIPQILQNNETAQTVVNIVYMAMIPLGIVFAVLLYKKRKQPQLIPVPRTEPPVFFGPGGFGGFGGPGPQGPGAGYPGGGGAQGYGPQGPGYGPQGPGYGPQGPGYGPQGPGYGPQGPGYGPQGPGYGPQGPGMSYGPAPGYPQNPSGNGSGYNDGSDGFNGYNDGSDGFNGSGGYGQGPDGQP